MKPPQYDPSWSEEIKALHRHDLQEIWDPTISRNVWNQYHNQLEVYIDLVEKRAREKRLSIMDVGCAQATLALLLAERGHEVYAVDIRSHFLDYARSRYTHGDISFVAGNIFDLSFDVHFDIIFANQIVEHIVYPQQLFEHLKSFISDGGSLVVTTPNQEYIANNLPSFLDIGDVSNYEEKQFTADADGHFFAYKASELCGAMVAAGFSRNAVTFFESPFISGHMKIRYLHKIVPVSLLQELDTLLLRMPKVGKILAHQLMVVGELL